MPTVDTLRALDLEQLGVVVGVSPRRVGAAPYPTPSNVVPVGVADSGGAPTEPTKCLLRDSNRRRDLIRLDSGVIVGQICTRKLRSGGAETRLLEKINVAF